MANGSSNRTPQDTIYKIDDVTVVPAQNSLKKPGDIHRHLRPQTFAVLLYFCENSGRIISKTELFSNVWKKADVNDDSLVQCMVEIRRALGKKSGKNLRTITGRGYLLKAVSAKDDPTPQTDTRDTAIVLGPISASDDTEQKQQASALRDSLITNMVQFNKLPIRLLTSPAKSHQYTSVYYLHVSLHTKRQRVRATVYLEDRNNSQIIWAETYEEKTSDIFELQDRLGQTIANDILEQLKHRLDPANLH